MGTLDINLKERSLDYTSKLITNPLSFKNHSKDRLAFIIKDNLEKGKSSQNLASDLGHYTKKWNIDWRRIAHHIIQDYYNIRQAQTYLKMYGSDQKVYKFIDKTYCPDCFALYLTDINNPKSEPKLFTLSELIANGSNLGKKKKDWKPVIGVTDFGFREYNPYGYPELKEVEHYYDNTLLFTKAEWEIWDSKEGRYKKKIKKLTKRQKKIKSLVKVKITDDESNTISDTNKTENKSILKQKKWWQNIFK